MDELKEIREGLKVYMGFLDAPEGESPFEERERVRRALEACDRLEAREVEPAEGYWWCPECREEVDAHRVTFQECHDTCGRHVIWKEPLREAEAPKDSRELANRINETVHFDKSIPGLFCWAIDLVKSEAEIERFVQGRIRDAFQPELCPNCGPDGLVRVGGGDGHTCPECGGSHEKRTPKTVSLVMLHEISERVYGTDEILKCVDRYGYTVEP